MEEAFLDLLFSFARTTSRLFFPCLPIRYPELRQIWTRHIRCLVPPSLRVVSLGLSSKPELLSPEALCSRVTHGTKSYADAAKFKAAFKSRSRTIPHS